METKSILFGLIGFFLGGLLVSVAASTFEKPEPSMDMSAQSLEAKTGDEFDEAFLHAMIAHHESALDMAELAETNAKHGEIKQLSNEILDTQSQEIDQMKTWQIDWGYNQSTEHSASESGTH